MPLKGPADDGKRLGLSESALDVAYTGGAKMGRGSGGGGAKYRAGAEADGFMLRPLNDEKPHCV